DLVRLHDPQLVAVPVAQPPLAVEQQVGVHVRLVVGGLGDQQVGDRRVVGVGEQVDVPAGEVLGGAAGERAHDRVGHQDVTVQVDQRLGDRRAEEQGLEQLAPIGEQGVD